MLFRMLSSLQIVSGDAVLSKQHIGSSSPQLNYWADGQQSLFKHVCILLIDVTFSCSSWLAFFRARRVRMEAHKSTASTRS